jgi:hypothetical protein
MFCLPLLTGILTPFIDAFWPGVTAELMATPAAGKCHADRQLLRSRGQFLGQAARVVRAHGHRRRLAG